MEPTNSDQQPQTPAAPPPTTEAPQSTQPQAPTPQVTQQPSPVIGNMPNTAGEQPAKKGALKKLSVTSVALIAVAVILMGSAAAYFGFIVPNKPENIWKSALNNSSKALQGLTSYSEEQKDIKGTKLSGNLSVSATGLAGDLNVNGQYYEKQGSFTADVGFAGSRYNGEVRAVAVENSEYPDLYVKVDGIAGLGALLGAQSGSDGLGSMVDSLDGQWVFIDHTAIEGVANQASNAQSQAETDVTADDVIAISNAVNKVNDEYLFSTDESKAVLRVAEQVGKEDYEGRSAYKYLVGINKDNFKAYLEALKNELRSTRLPELMGDEYDRMFDSAITEVNDSTEIESETVEVWVDTSTKTIRNIRFKEKDNDKNYLDVSFLYEGGNSYPLRFKFIEEDTKSDMSFLFTLNTDTDALTADINIAYGEGQEKMTAEGSFTVEPLNEAPTIEVPEGAKSINELISDYYEALSSNDDLQSLQNGTAQNGVNNVFQSAEDIFEGFSL